ncbi:MAG: glycolate oxidase iron-sulfur subunit [Actinomycetota bacterium]|jgi:glycolate oxidase iron-sulfur subunit|nr:glycolate oxidase iron-sulfur subunit [Actinomycetota bacterium]
MTFTPDLLSRCISCGFCLPACPTYELTKDERSSPRGRIALMRALETGTLPMNDPGVAEESSFCLGCRACEVVCPAGVEYGQLLEEWRDATWRGRRRPVVVRALLRAVDRTWKVRLLGLFRRHARRRTGGSASLMLGCFERFLYPKVSRSAVALDPRLDVDPGQGCCGALHAHNGELAEGRALARKLGERLPGTIVTTSGGCAAHLADVLGRDRVVELSAWLSGPASAAGAALPGPAGPILVDGRPARIGLQDSCHLRNGLGVWREPRAILAALGEYVEVPGAASCCGAAGTYALVRPEDSAKVVAPKVDALRRLDLDILVTVNPGCTRQLQTAVRKAGLRTRVVHLAELAASARTDGSGR